MQKPIEEVDKIQLDKDWDKFLVKMLIYSAFRSRMEKISKLRQEIDIHGNRK